MLFIWSCGFFQDGGKPVIKTYDGQWQSIRVNNAIVEFIIEKVVHKSLAKNVQDVVEMLDKMVVGLEPLNKTLAWAKENDQNRDEASIYYLKNYEDRWKTWVTPKAYKRIDKALKQHLKSSVSDVGNLRS